MKRIGRTLGSFGIAAGLIAACAQGPELANEAAANEAVAEQAAGPIAGRARVETPSGIVEMAYKDVGGLAIAEGDIVLGRTVEVSGKARSAALISAGALWPTGLPVYYDFDVNLPQAQRTLVKDAVAYWRANTDVDLRLRTDTSITDYIRFRDSTICASDVGRLGGVQYVETSSSCTLGNMKHEIGHAMGLWHEQSRNDRDSYVIYTEACVSVDPDDERHNFDKYTSGADLGAYDFTSIMHYGSDFFCADTDGDGACDCLPLTKLDGSFITPQRIELTQGDRYGVAQLYGPRTRSVGSWHTSFGQSVSWPNAVKTTGDFNGDGKDDIVAFLRNVVPTGTQRGDVLVALSSGTAFGASSTWHTLFCVNDDSCVTGDFNGDGKDDILSFTPTTDDVYVATSAGTRFNPASRWKDGFCYPGEVCRVADVNGDGKEDVISFNPHAPGLAKGDVFVALSTGTSFGVRTKVHEHFCVDAETCHVADMTADGVADLVLTRANGTVLMAVGTGTGTFGTQVGGTPGATCVGAKACEVADVTGDMRADVISFWGDTHPGNDKGDVRISRRSNSVLLDGFRPEALTQPNFCTGNEQCGVGDVNGDGRANLVRFSSASGIAVWVALSAKPYAGE